MALVTLSPDMPTHLSSWANPDFGIEWVAVKMNTTAPAASWAWCFMPSAALLLRQAAENVLKCIGPPISLTGRLKSPARETACAP